MANYAAVADAFKMAEQQTKLLKELALRRATAATTKQEQRDEAVNADRKRSARGNRTK